MDGYDQTLPISDQQYIVLSQNTGFKSFWDQSSFPCYSFEVEPKSQNDCWQTISKEATQPSHFKEIFWKNRFRTFGLSAPPQMILTNWPKSPLFLNKRLPFILVEIGIPSIRVYFITSPSTQPQLTNQVKACMWELSAGENLIWSRLRDAANQLFWKYFSYFFILMTIVWLL